MKKITYNILAIILLLQMSLSAQRIKDIAYLSGSEVEQVIGYGLVVGLAGSGDSQRSAFTVQSVTSMLKRFGITIPQDQLKTKNVAAVMVTATLNSFLKSGSKFDVVVSSMGDSKSLAGGTLLMTPLSGLSGEVYGVAQGPLSVGGFDVQTSSGSRVSKNHTSAGRVPRGGVLRRDINPMVDYSSGLSVLLKNPDLTTASNVSNIINSTFGNATAKANDASEIVVTIPADKQNNIIQFLSELESLEVTTDYIAKVVLNERTGTVVAGSHVKIMPVSITHGNLNIDVKSNPVVSQPGDFSRTGRTVFFNNLTPKVTEDSSKTIAINGASNVQEVATALNSLKVTPQDIISIFQALKESGALVAELVII
ncbi:MAG: flagellar biosynthesis protein FlgA [Ignavibacteriales bacterium CG18_big_fil_WC_8_21_14_2_50_31_20]|nr:MAG: flagellar biosynthesis protein FlgA [Ignavibacteriales bacterium CG18_big_fil_WC_8_21_14_2_50_31_20]